MQWLGRFCAAGVLALALLGGLAAVATAQEGGDRAAAPQQPAQISASGAAQMALLQAEKESRTPAQRKISSQLLLALRRWRNEPIAQALPALRTLAPGDDGRVLVDITLADGAALKPFLSLLSRAGGEVLYQSAEQRAVRAFLPLDQVEVVAASPAVRHIRPAAQPVANSDYASRNAWALAPFLPAALDRSEGIVTHQADLARELYGVTGAGQKICVISDGVDSLADAQVSGDLPPVVDILPGQAGSGDEGTAMLEIVHDLAPGAGLGFATAHGGEAQFADNIRSLHASGCHIIVDDVSYLSESPFQDETIAQAAIDVTEAGALFFSSAANDGNLDSYNSGTWEGDFKANGSLPGLAGGSVHDFGDGGQSNVLTGDASILLLHWNDPNGFSSNDYDLYVMDETLQNVLGASTDIQDGDDAAYESLFEGFSQGARVVVLRKEGAAVRMMNVLAWRSTLQLAMAGATRGHSAAPLAFSVAAVPAAEAFFGGGPTGPYPNPFTAADQVEWFSSDGPRRIYFDYDGNFLPGAPAGDYSANGGVVRQKPDIAAADGVSTSAPGFKPFFGTSAAAPHAAAVAGLLWEAFPLSSTLEIRGLLQETALDIMAPGVDRNAGHGLIMPVPALALGGAQPRAILTGAGPILVEVVGNGDDFIDPLETWQFSLPLSNTGAAGAFAISGALATSAPGVTLLANTAAYPDLSPGAQGANDAPFVFAVGAEVACGSDVAFTLTLQYTDTASRTATLPLKLVTGHLSSAPLSFAYTGPAVPIPVDANLPVAATVPLSVSGVSGLIAQVQFRIDGSLCTTDTGAVTVGVDHSYVEDLDFRLESPGGVQTLLIDQTGGDGNNFCQTLLDDGAATPIATVAPEDAPFTGAFQPEEPLAAFAGSDANGVWRLHVSDEFAEEDNGNVRAFSLHITPRVCAGQAEMPVLDALALDAGALEPEFDPAIVTYTAQLPAASQLLTLAPSTAWTGGTLYVDGAPTASGSPVTVTLAAGAHHTVTIELRTGSGVVLNRYSIVANRAPHLPTGAWGTLQQTPVTFDALAAADDADGDAVTLISAAVQTTTYGVASALGGAVTYTPALDFGDVAVLELAAQDGRGGAAAALAYVTVGAAGAGRPQVTAHDATQVVTGVLQAAHAATVTLEIPPGAYSGTLGADDLFYLVYTQVLTPAGGALPPGFQPAGQFFTLAGYRNAAGLPALRFAQPITLTLQYDGAESIGDVLPETLTLWYWDATAGQWSQDGLVFISHDPAARRITYTVAHLSEFAFLGQTEAPITNQLYLPGVLR